MSESVARWKRSNANSDQRDSIRNLQQRWKPASQHQACRRQGFGLALRPDTKLEPRSRVCRRRLPLQLPAVLGPPIERKLFLHCACPTGPVNLHRLAPKIDLLQSKETRSQWGFRPSDSGSADKTCVNIIPRAVVCFRATATVLCVWAGARGAPRMISWIQLPWRGSSEMFAVTKVPITRG